MIDAALGTQYAIQVLSSIVPGFAEPFRKSATNLIEKSDQRSHLWKEAENTLERSEAFLQSIAKASSEYETALIELQEQAIRMVTGAYQVCKVASLLQGFLFHGEHVASPLGVELATTATTLSLRTQAIGNNAYPSASNHAYQLSRNAVLAVAGYATHLAVPGLVTIDAIDHARNDEYWKLVCDQLRHAKPIDASEIAEQVGSVESGLLTDSHASMNNIGETYDYKSWHATAKVFRAAGLEVARVLDDFTPTEIQERQNEVELGIEKPVGNANKASANMEQRQADDEDRPVRPVNRKKKKTTTPPGPVLILTAKFLEHHQGKDDLNTTPLTMQEMMDATKRSKPRISTYLAGKPFNFHGGYRQYVETCHDFQKLNRLLRLLDNPVAEFERMESDLKIKLDEMQE